MVKVQTISSWLLPLLTILLLGAPLLIAIEWLFIDSKVVDACAFINFFGLLERVVLTPSGYVNLSSVAWKPFSKLLGFSADLLALVPFLLGLVVLRSVFKEYQKGEVFTVLNALYYQKLGWLFFIDALLIKPLSYALMVLAITLNNPVGERCIALQYGMPHLKALFLGSMLIVISWVLQEAAKLHEEQKLTI